MGRHVFVILLSVLNERVGISTHVTVTESPHPHTLLWLRFLAFLVATLLVVVGIKITTHDYFIFFTHWGAMLTCLYFTLILAAYILEEMRPIAYVVFEMIFVIEFIVTLGFWTTVYPFMNVKVSMTYTVAVHGGLMSLIICDYLLNKIRFISKHLWLTIVVMLFYAVVSVVFTLSVRPIYPMLTFKDFTSYLMIAFTLGIGYLGHRLAQWCDSFKYQDEEAGARFELGTLGSDK